MVTCKITSLKNKSSAPTINDVLEKTGEGQKYSKILFSKSDYPYLIDEPLEVVNSGTEWVMEDGAFLQLVANADQKIFKANVPIIHAKGLSNLKFSVNIDGNKDKQSVKWGKGYHNAIYLENCTKVEVMGSTIKHSQGDGLRTMNTNDILFYNNRIFKCGHDGLYAQNAKNVKAYNNWGIIRTNSLIRFRNVSEGEIYNNTGIALPEDRDAYSPGIIIQKDNGGGAAINTYIHDNTITGTFGPGAWIIGRDNASPDNFNNLVISNNKFVSCGQMPKENKIPGEGGIVWNGASGKIENNEFFGCWEHSVMFGDWVSANASGSGYKVEVNDNVFANTRKGNYPGTASGYALADLSGRHKITVSGNRFWDNKYGNLYKIVA